MSRLPTVGEDNDQWGSILNEYLSVEHNTDGTQKLLTEDVSRTIYVATTGNDTTGDGTSLLPYLTIGKALSTINKNIDSGVTVTISIGVGTFIMSINDMNILSSISGAGALAIQGTLTLVESGFTQGAAEALDPLTYAVSGGNTGSWGTDQWKYYFIKKLSNYYPITHNTTTSVSVSYPNTAMSEIYETQTVLNVNGDILTRIELLIAKLKIVTSSATAVKTSLNGYLSLMECLIDGSSLMWTVTDFSRMYCNRSCFKNLQVSLRYNSTASFFACYLYSNFDAPLIAISTFDLMSLFYNVFENPNTGPNSCAVFFSAFSRASQASNSYTKFVNCNLVFKIVSLNNPNIIQGVNTNKIILKNTNYFHKNANTISGVDYLQEVFTFNNANFYGAPVLKWFYDTMQEFVNLSSGRNIQITGIVYPEHESNLSSTLVDNTVTNVIVGNKLQNRSIIIDYTITRGTLYEAGRLRIVHNGTTLSLTEDTPTGDDVGVTFAVNFNTNEIRLACTLTATGSPATMKYNATRVMITPLTI